MENIEANKVYLQIGFRSPEPFSKLKTIELFGVPGQKLSNGQCIIDETMQQFCDDLIVKDLFRRSSRLANCNFEDIKIWFYNQDHRKIKGDIGYKIPRIDNFDFRIPSNSSISKLKEIYVLDNELEGEEYQNWQENAKNLFSPLFSNFIAPPEKPEIVTNAMKSNNPLSKALGSFADALESVSKAGDPYMEIKRGLFFNALIIEID